MKTLNMTIVALLIGTITNSSVAQTCIPDAEPVTPSSRFILQGSEVIDQRTGLIWQRCSVGQSWNAATQSCDGEPLSRNWKDTLDQVPQGWRVPNIRELNSITEFTCSRPAINLAVFPDTPLEFYWSSTPVIRGNDSLPTLAWVIFQVNNGIPGGISKESTQLVRLVRDGSQEN